MPIYEYRCEACGNIQEAIQKMSDAPLKLCAACGQEALARLMSRTSFVLKGSGWYATDYKAPSAGAKADAAAASSSAAPASAAPASTSSSSDSKP